ncbi:DNA polymerase [Nocardia rhizosphaerihabitans]|uniref:DNA polymerase n=1 Tax=Nocardia rhizosphaerihabitans TaxID=1691570 RepID=UPI00366AB6C1
MRDYPYKIGSEQVTVRVVENAEDLAAFEEWATRAMSAGAVGVDCETTGLEMYAGDTLRTVQFGDAYTGWVLPVEKSPRLAAVAAEYVRRIPLMVGHNIGFDLRFIDRHLGVSLEDTWPRSRDTYIYSHLIDPLEVKDGGIGHSLEALTRKYVDAKTADEVKGSITGLAKEYKTTKDKVWSIVDIDHPGYNLYAGMDPILAVRLFQKLEPKVPSVSAHLVPYEHLVAMICSLIDRNGFLLDQEYSQGLSDKLRADEEYAAAHAMLWFGVESVNSTDDVASGLMDLGFRIPGRTATGKYKVDKALLDSLVVDDPEIGSPAHLAAAVQEAKRASKWRSSWVDKFLNGTDAEGRIHPYTNPLRARTARMSITGIPAQTLPSGDWIVRRCFIADPGQTIVSVDYKAQELRVLAALSGDPTMRAAFAEDADLHQLTADAAGVDRKVGKMANFLQVYGGGAAKLADNAGVPFPVAKRVIQAFAAKYPGVAELSKSTQAEAKRNGRIVTATGRVIPVDPDRAYAGLNYKIQSASRDVTARGLINLHNAGFTPYMRLVVHDEVVASLPIEHAEYGSREIARHMRMDLRGVDIDTDPEIYGMSWGHGYIKD